jgi:hypothetical protein
MITACCTSTCFEDLKEFLGQANYTLLLDKGFVEEDTVNGTSLICKLVPFFTNNNISTTEAVAFLDKLLDKGFVYDCTQATVIASVETYLKYAEAVGLTQSASVPA